MIRRRESIDAAKEKIRELNQTAREFEIPIEKTLTIGVQFKQYGEMPMPQIGKYNIQGMQQYAEGGYADEPSIFGEAGPEMAIPIDKSQRSRNLHAMTGRMLGVDSGSSGDSPTLNFNINITGGESNVKSQVQEGIRMGLREFENLYIQMQRNRRRVSMSQ